MRGNGYPVPARKSGTRSENFGQVEGAAARILGDLFAATEAVGNENGLRLRVANGRQKDAFGECLGDLVFFALEAEGASHAAAAGVEKGDVGPGLTEQVEL